MRIGQKAAVAAAIAAALATCGGDDGTGLEENGW